MACQHCGTSISDWANYCPHCGHRTACVHNDDQLIGGPCRYGAIAGSAVITSVREAEDSPDVQILFDFTPEDPSAPQRYRFPTWGDQGKSLTVQGGLKPSGGWALRHKVLPGAVFRCVRQEIVSGTCQPVIFEFPDLPNASG
jgi:hypothetical protein